MALILGVQYGTPVTSTTYTGIPAGTILPCAANSPLLRTLLCDGSAVSRTTYADLFTAISTAYGNGDGVNTFNLPDLRYTFPRGRGAAISQIGTGNIASTVNFTVLTDLVTLANHGLTNGSKIQFRTITGTTGISAFADYFVVNATTNNFQLSLTLGGSVIDLTGIDGTGVFRNFGVFTNHGITRTGMRVRITGTAPAPLALSQDFYAIVVNENNLAFSSTYSAAMLGLVGSVVITTPGTSIASTTVVQWEDPDLSTRLQAAVGGNTTGIGTRQVDQNLNHFHDAQSGSNSGTPPFLPTGSAFGGPGVTLARTGERGGLQANPINVYVNYCIAF
jgi:microcystin-dependent protein